MSKPSKVLLEKHTEAFIQQITSAGGPPLYKLTPSEAREILEKVQSIPVEKPVVKIEERKIPVGPRGVTTVYIIRPENRAEKLPVIMYFHGAGWVMGSEATHDRLVRELAVGAQAAVVFVDYSRSPESAYPIANEECYAATKYISEHGANFNLDSTHLAVAGDSVGGNMAIAVTLMAKEK